MGWVVDTLRGDVLAANVALMPLFSFNQIG
jgi:hypothetical protein